MTNAEILELAPGAGFLASNAKGKSVLFRGFGSLNPILPQQIFGLYFIIKKIYDNDPNYSGMTPACNYLWEIMGRYGISAQQFTGGGGSVSPVTPSNVSIYPFLITSVAGVSSDFESDGVSYDNPNIVGDNIMIFINEFSQQWLVAGAGYFNYTATGFQIITTSGSPLEGFNANTQSYTIVVQQVFGSGGGSTPTGDFVLSETGNNLITEGGNNIIIE